MTAQAPDPREFKHWEDAFQYPLPVIRKLEQQLRTNINDNRDKVRSLVGSGYRDLLGTADRIIAINEEVLELTDAFSEIGQKCSSRSVEKAALYNGRLAKARCADSASQRSLAAEGILLQSALLHAQRLLRAGSDQTLLIARLLLLARLLSNSLSRSDPGKELIRTHRLKLGSIRRRFLAYIDVRLADLSTSRAQISDALLSYALTNSSSHLDSLHHFLRVREAQISQQAEDHKRRSIVRGYDLLIATIEQARSLFPHRFSDAIDRITLSQLLQDNGLRLALVYDLENCESWVNPDIRSFVPWLRNEEMTQMTLSRELADWWSNVNRLLSTELTMLLESTSRPAKVSELREIMLRHLLAKELDVPGIDKHELILQTNATFQRRLEGVIQTRAERAPTIVSTMISASLSQTQSAKSLWDLDYRPTDMRSGAHVFRGDIANRIKGLDPSLQQLDDLLAAWCEKIDDLNSVVKHIRTVRWEAELDIDLDEDHPGFDYQTLFSHENPLHIEQQLAKNLEKSMKTIAVLIQDAARAIKSKEVMKVLYLLRVIHIMSLHKYRPLAADLQTSQHELHELLAESVISTNEETERSEGTVSMSNIMSNIFRARTTPLALWQGSPPLPTQPLPSTFRLLRELSKAMNELGMDVWTKPAVESVKAKVQRAAAESARALLKDRMSNGVVHGTKKTMEAIEQAVSADEEAKGRAAGNEAQGNVNDSDSDGMNAEGSKTTAVVHEVDQHWTQMLFDLLYLQHVLKMHAKEVDSSFAEVVELIRSKAALAEDSFNRLEANASAYHGRSYLLFGILA